MALNIGREDSPFPKAAVTRMADWSWRIESENVFLREVGCTTAEGTGQGDGWDLDRSSDGKSSGGEHLSDSGYVAVVVDGDVFYVQATDAQVIADMGATLVG
jgi:hypothetical protein